MLGEEVAKRRQPMARWVRKAAWIVVPAALIGEFGHHLLEHLGQALAHHFFHILFAGGASLIFGVFAWRDVRKYGWPSFSWRLRPDRPEPRRPRTTG